MQTASCQSRFKFGIARDASGWMVLCSKNFGRAGNRLTVASTLANGLADSDLFTRDILPKLPIVLLRRIARVTGYSTAHSSHIRQGKLAPDSRVWPVLCHDAPPIELWNRLLVGEWAPAEAKSEASGVA
jgi:hypothetical protein